MTKTIRGVVPESVPIIVREISDAMLSAPRGIGAGRRSRFSGRWV
jgi:hypothetical protein